MIKRGQTLVCLSQITKPLFEIIFIYHGKNLFINVKIKTNCPIGLHTVKTKTYLNIKL